ncbi:MAG: TIGR02266 family protein [Archangium sp.]|nr:TIGR02266 family protein [Archangium sp.]MDP3156925.1 TIGR02266 family protein [Archangium sp.]MDP3575605.1 TIGR02266 family protein [Archangium sp.]
MSIERREFARQRVSRVEVRVASREAFRASYLRDLSMGGLFVRSRQPLAQGTTVVVELAVENQPPVRLRGEVMRQEHAADGTPRGFGVRFSTVDEVTKRALEEILLAHTQSEAPPAVEQQALETQLSEARGTIEAYEESMALLRQSETEAFQQLEAAQAERDVLAQVSHELQGRVHALEAERTELTARVAALSARLSKGDAELNTLHATTSRLAAELKAARSQAEKTSGSREDAVSRLMAEFEAETERAAALKAELDAEVRSLREQLEAKDDSKLREELQEFAAQLDDERLKSMALERALQRFVEMGGIIPKRTE